MVGVGARLRHIGDLRAGELSILSAVGVGDDRRFADFVLAQRKVRRTRVVDVEVRVHVVFAVDRKQVRRGRHAVDREVAVTAGAVHDRARSRVGDVGDVTTSARQLRYFFCGKCGVLAGLSVDERRRPETSTVSVPLAPTVQTIVTFEVWPTSTSMVSAEFRKTGLLHR